MTTELAPLSRASDVADRPDVTPRRVRIVSVGVLAALFATVVLVRGLPQDYFSIFAWLWLLSVAWDIGARPVTHLVFLRDWTLPLVMLTFYMLSRGIADDLGTPIHFTYPIRVDTFLGGGETPSALLQHAWCGNPCDPTTPPQWFDRFFIMVWMSHFTVGLSLAVVFWLRNRAEFGLWMRRYLIINGVALVCYVLVPTAPPWMASMDGRLPSDVHRLSARAWVGPRPEGVGGADPMSWVGNSVAAMPSLHAGVAFLIAFYAIQRLRHPLRWCALLYPLAMTTALVYLGEHYVADVLGGALLAAAVIWGCDQWERRRGAAGTRATGRPAAAAHS